MKTISAKELREANKRTQDDFKKIIKSKKFTLSFDFERDGKYFVVQCKESPGIISQGVGFYKSMMNIAEATCMLVEVLEKNYWKEQK